MNLSVESIVMILQFLLNTRMTWLIFMKIIMNTIQIKKVKYWSYLIEFVADMRSRKKLYPVVTELFIRGRQLNISLFLFHNVNFIMHTQLCILFYYKNTNKRELQQIAVNHPSDIDFKDFKRYKKWTAEPYSFVVNDATFSIDNVLRFRHNLWESILKVTMTIDEKIRQENLYCNGNREA